MYQFGHSGALRAISNGTSTGNSRGAIITSPTNAVNTKGNWTAVGPATTLTTEYSIIVARASNGPAVYNGLLDIGLQTSGGSVQTIIENLRMPHNNQAGQGRLFIPVPVHIPKSSQIVARLQASASGSLLDVSVVGFSAGPFGMPGFAKWLAFGVNSALSQGTPMSYAVANTDGSVIALTSAVPVNVKAMFHMVGDNQDNSRLAGAQYAYTVLLGPSGSETAIQSLMMMDLKAGDDELWPNQTCIFPCDIKSGTRLSAYMRSPQLVADGSFDLIVYGGV